MTSSLDVTLAIDDSTYIDNVCIVAELSRFSNDWKFAGVTKT
jgi:hypothetical protein